MKTLFTYFSKNGFKPENGPIHSRQLFAVLVMMWVKLVNLVNFVMQIFVESAESAKSAKPIFATFATFASANFVGKASCESTVMYRVKSRILSCLFRYSLDSNLSRFSLVSLICLCMLTVGSGNVWADYTIIFKDGSGTDAINASTLSNFINSGTSYVTSASSSYMYPSGGDGTGYGIRLASGSYAGNLTLNLSATGQIKASKITFNAAYYSSDESTMPYTITYTDATTTTGTITSLSTSLADKEVSLTSTKTIQTIHIGTTAKKKRVYVHSITVTAAAAATPTVTPDPTSLSWGTVLQGSSQSTKTISITGSNLTAGTLTISATGGYSVTPTSKSVSGTLAATTLTVTPPSTSTTGAKNGKVTISGGGLASAVEVNLSMNVNAASTVTWMNNGSEYTTTLVANGSKPEFPSNPSSCDGISTTFVGWTPTPWSGKLDDVSAKTIYTSGSAMPNVSGPVTYHAVFAKAGTASGNYKKGSIDDLTEGQTVIIVNSNSGYALSSDQDQYGCQVATNAGISSGTISSPSSDLIWEIELGENGGYNIKQGDNYLNAYYYNSKHRIFFDQYPDEWQVSGSGPYVLSSTEDPGYQLWYDGDYYDFGTETGTSGIAYNMDFYVPAPSYSKYLTTCCTPLGEPATLTLEKTAHAIKATWTATSGGNETGYSVQLYDNSGGEKGSEIGDPVSRTSSQLTYTFEDLTANHKYYVGVTPTYSGDGDYCTTGTEKLVSVTTDQVYTVTYNSGGGSGTITDSNSPYEAGDEVTVKENTFTKSGYTFTAWSYSSAVTVTDGKFEMPSSNVVITATWTAKKNYYVDRMHGNCDGVNTVTIDGVVYNCYLREGAGYTRPDLTDNDGGTNDCITSHAHFIGWVAAGNISADGSYSSGTIYAGGSSGTATTDGTIYYAVWAEE